MKKLNYLSALFFLFSIIIGTNINAQEKLSAKEIVVKANDLVMGNSSFSKMKMTIVRPEWSRTVSMQSWSIGNDYYMIYITAPARDNGQVFMKRLVDMWNWMPSIDRMIKIPPSMMMSSWMGSDFSNNDLMKQNSIIVDYSHKIISSDSLENYDCYKIELIPLPESPVVWNKVIMWIEKNHYYQLKCEYYGNDNTLVNIEKASNVQQMGDRKIPTKLEIIPVQKKGHKTVLDIVHQEFNVKKVTKDFFSQQMMKRIRPEN
ncbi:MAG: outer membrane lipoprotein-sorting protein [Bacteroidales bacterium]|nr:outer membrane lipoprotein-sorting protein [Bacteroidales bacterium]